MAWPPAYGAAFIGTGSTTIKWGTDGIMANGSPNGNGSGGVGGFYTIESVRPADEIENIYIEQGTGLKATRIQLMQGRQYVFTVVDDTNMTHPAMGNLIQAVDPMSTALLQFRITQNGYSTQRKTEGKREVTAEYLTLIEGGGNIPPI